MAVDEEERSNGKDSEDEPKRLDEREPSVSDLVVRVHEPDVYTPTLDLSSPRRGTSPVFQLGERRILRGPSKELETAGAERQREENELRAEVERDSALRHSERWRSWAPFLWAFFLSLIVWGVVVLFDLRFR